MDRYASVRSRGVPAATPIMYDTYPTVPPFARTQQYPFVDHVGHVRSAHGGNNTNAMQASSGLAVSALYAAPNASMERLMSTGGQSVPPFVDRLLGCNPYQWMYNNGC